MKTPCLVLRLVLCAAIVAGPLIILPSLFSLGRAETEWADPRHDVHESREMRGSSHRAGGAMTGTGSRMTSEEAREVVTLHNKARAEVGVGPVSWANTIAEYAQKWADSLGARCNLEHRPHSGSWKQIYGENLYAGMSGDNKPADAVSAWASEKRYFRGGRLDESNWYESGHYTQVVWKDTKRIGCGMAVCRGELFVVCNYDPPGNVLGRQPY
jgi:pathogenesis-related protein 1